MCGPLLITLHRGKANWWNEHLHHSGRLLTYMTMGAIAGAIGGSFSVLGVQQWFSMVMGALMILSVLMIPFARFLKRWETSISRWSVHFTSWIHGFGSKGNEVKFMLGIANGILPCGLVYMAVAGAANTFTPWDGALFMLIFGLGTMPVLVALLHLGEMVPVKWRNRSRRLIPVTIVVLGLLLMVRGMNLGIPMLSPQGANSSAEITACH